MSEKLASCRGNSRSEYKGKTLFSPAAAELRMNTTGSFTEGLLYALLHGIIVSPPCRVSYIHAPNDSRASCSRRLPALTQKLNLTLPGSSREVPQTPHM